MTLRIALRALMRNKMRSLLTMLGIIIGVGSVIAMLSIANGARMSVEKKLTSMGVNTVHIFGGSRPRSGVRAGRNTGIRMKADDWKAVAELPYVIDSCPFINGNGQMVYGSANWGCSWLGTTPSFIRIRNWPVARGRFFTDAEVTSAVSVAVLGKTVVDKLFGAADPLDKTIRIGNQPFRVIGVLEERGDSGWGNSKDDNVLVPYTTAQRRLRGNLHIDGISAVAPSPELVAPLQDQVIILLKGRYNCRLEDQDAFYARNQADEMKTAEENTRVFTILLAGIASVSLLVGGIGIMNIMLVSVTERVREIGIRMALGARGSDVLMQFLVEAVVLSMLGGGLGVLAGAGTALWVARMAQWPAVVSEASVVISFLFAAGVGIFFGFYPALQASRLDPIEALRHE